MRVPRQNAQRLGPNLNSTVRSVGRKDGFIVQIPPPVQEQPSAAGASSSAVSRIIFSGVLSFVLCWSFVFSFGREERERVCVCACV